jgi:enterochelin esterase-like enzyme
MKSMKKGILLIAGLSALLLAACGGNSTAMNETSSSSKTSRSSSQLVDTGVRGTDERGFETITYSDIIDGQTTEFSRVPVDWSRTSTKKGTVEQYEYDTSVYGEDHVYHKHANVYLPYGYDAQDTSKKYNVIYMQHGNNQLNDNLCSAKTELMDKIMLDNLFDEDKGGIDPAIVVFTTFYFDNTKTIAGDQQTADTPANFYLEVMQDIVPGVESKYNTYAESFDEAGLKASRAHRAFSGYSRGSCATWMMMIREFDYFQYWIPMSATSLGTSAFGANGKQNEKTPWEELKETLDAHKDLPFFIYGAAGGIKDGPGMGLNSYMNELSKQTDYFSYGKDPKVNNLYYTVADYDHADQVFPYYWYNALQVVFQQ